jgi:6-phosphogluconolactonase
MTNPSLRRAAYGCLPVFAALASLSAMQSMSQQPVVVYATVGNSLRAFSLDAATGAMQQRSATSVSTEIHYVAMHPTRRYLYVSSTDRADLNALHAFAIDARTGSLTPLGEPLSLPPSLSRAVHITVDQTGRYLLTANNVTESAGVVRLMPDGRLGELIAQPQAQKLGFLVHQIRIDSSNRWVFVPVRGNDAVTEGKTTTTPEQMGRLHVFSFNEGMLNKEHTIEYESGSGPRHIDFHPTQPWLYALTERGNQIVTYRRDAGALTDLFRTTTLRDPSFTFPPQRAGAIHVHPNGRWVYVTNRNVQPCASSRPCPDHTSKPFAGGENNIALFSIDEKTGRPTLVGHTDSHGFEPRTFTIDPSGNFLIVGNMMNIARKDDERIIDVQPNLSVFRIGGDGRLTFLRSYDQPGAGLIWWVGAYGLGGQ